MADYYAVLNRTLAGFGEPKPQLREKLYDRARTTIRRQLENRTPPLDESMFEAELASLEDAIAEIERGFAEKDGQTPADTAAPSAPEPEPVAAAPVDAKDDGPTTEATEEEPAPQEDRRAPEAAAVDNADSAGSAAQPEGEAALPQEPPAAAGPRPIELPVFEPEVSPVEPAPEENIPDPVKARKASLPSISDPAAEAISSWAEDFLGEPDEAAGDGDQPSLRAVPAADEPAAPAARKPAVADSAPTREADAVPVVKESPDTGKPPTEPRELPPFPEKPDETLVIPPAAGRARAASSRNRGPIWALLAILAVFAAAVIATYVYWDDRGAILSSLGLGDLVGEEEIKPTPVKTITIKPDPVVEEPEPEDTGEQTGQAEPDEPKAEDRLFADPERPTPTETDPVAGEPIIPDIAPTTQQTGVETPAGDNAATETPSASESASSDGTPVTAESAILYEEQTTGSTPFNGTVSWSRVDEPTGDGEGTDPAIRARVEIPDRKMVLIMTLKRNRDRALPASHLIELIFAVSDDFEGGSVSEVNRFVLKESEQARGSALAAVPARIADGIFLLALNNLQKDSNEELLRSRSWIDIPLQYRTGRRALVTLEKGAAGNSVFDEVFAAWKGEQG